MDMDDGSGKEEQLEHELETRKMDGSNTGQLFRL